MSIYHDKTGLILGGGNTKLQPAWSNFTVGDVRLLSHTPGDTDPDFLPKGKLHHVLSAATVILEPTSETRRSNALITANRCYGLKDRRGTPWDGISCGATSPMMCKCDGWKSPDYKKLYVADTGASHNEEAPRAIRVWDVVDGKRLANGRGFASMELDSKAGLADGIRADVDGNIWASAGWVGEGYDGVHIFAPNGDRIGQILLPEICSNVCFGGTKRNRLFMTASQSIYAVYVETRGAHIN